MKTLLNPRWILLLNIMPILVLFFLLGAEYRVINSLLEDENIFWWNTLWSTLFCLGAAGFVYTLTTIFQEKEISVWYGFVTIITYIVFLVFHVEQQSELFPRSIPNWMMSEDVRSYVGTFLMPTLAHALFVIVLHLTPDEKDYSIGKNFLGAISVPSFLFLFLQIVIPLRGPWESQFTEHVIIVLLIASVVVFNFMLVRTVYIFLTQKPELLGEYGTQLKFLICILFPIFGLMVNQTPFSHGEAASESGVFGNFGTFWFFLLAGLNGYFLCLPDKEHLNYRLGIFFLRCATFTYTLYFFLIFLPYLPFGTFAIIAFGLGFLVLTPLLLFVFHVNQLAKDFTYLRSHINKGLIWTLALAGTLILPGLLTISYWSDKETLNETLEYLYSPDYSKKYNIDSASLRTTIDSVIRNKD